MTPRIAITHHYEQRFEHHVQLSTHWLRLRPAPHTAANISAYSLTLKADPHWINWLRDPFENHLARVDLREPLAEFKLTVELIAELPPINPFDFIMDPSVATHPFDYSEQLRKELKPYLRLPKTGPRLKQWLAKFDRHPLYTVDRLNQLLEQVHQAINPVNTFHPGNVNLENVLAKKQGTAWEHAWLLTVALRHLGFAARFTNGYRIFTAVQQDLPAVVSQCAWSEVYLPGAGWIGLDPSAGLYTNEGYIPLASATEPLRVMPILGYHEACAESHHESISARWLVPEQPEWPLSRSQWQDVRALGCHIEKDLSNAGIHASTGTRLALVSHTDGGAKEWFYKAIGPTKRAKAELLVSRLRERIARGGVLQVSQGEWFAGEKLPRWKLCCYARSDDHPICQHAARITLSSTTGNAEPAHAQLFASTLCHALGVSAKHLIPAYEDPLYRLWQTHAPTAALVSGQDLKDPDNRQRLTEQLSAAPGLPVGYALPIRWDAAEEQWVGGQWRFRRRHLFLIPGDSALGYRLPLDSLVLDPESRLEAQLERCQFEARTPLPEIHGEIAARLSHPAPPQEAPALADTTRVPRTAICVEVRNGHLSVFLPPVSHLERYLEFVAAIEASAERLNINVMIEGYEPPQDYRLQRIELEPDAGVLQLSLPKITGWQAQLDQLQAAYQEATQLGLRGERIISDGDRLPSGGGACYTLAGPTPAQSPFLNRPEILRSLITYWQRHPALSYFFAGQAIGPSGPAPRPDEGRDESLYELSLALEHMDTIAPNRPWQLDRMLRHLLTDSAGDIKHAEIRVDQLYPPERASLRLGQIMLYAFETPPDYRLAALQSLLLTGLIGRFSQQPEQRDLIRWGGALHDRFMLPQALYDDLRTVMNDLQAVGYPFQLAWFDTLLELRYPVLGITQIREMTLELRRAHEPWALLGEEVSGGGVARFIDQSTERLQVKLSGMEPGRYILVCNGEQVPLQQGALHGEYYAGVRYKVANPPATLHPLVPPVGLLVFDLVDARSGHVVGGCSYTPTQPETFGPIAAPAVVPFEQGDLQGFPPPPAPPVTLPPMAGRGRFMPRGSGLSKLTPPERHENPCCPYLLDLTEPAASVALHPIYQPNA